MQLYKDDSLKIEKLKVIDEPTLQPTMNKEQQLKRSKSEKIRKTQPINFKISKSFNENTSDVESIQKDSICHYESIDFSKKISNLNENSSKKLNLPDRMLDENNNEEKMNQSMNSLITEEKKTSKIDLDDELIVSF